MTKKNLLQAGISLIEVVMTTALITVVISLILAFQNGILEDQQFILNSYISIQNVNQATQQFVKEIRNSQASDSGGYPLEIVNDNEIAFYSNVDKDSQIEKVRYFLDGTNLVKGITDPSPHPIQYLAQNEKTIIVAENLILDSTPVFYYYGDNYLANQTPLPQLQRATQTKLVEINLTSNSNPNYLKENYQSHALAQIRILKDNL